ncbi:hypothetical protein ABW44_10965, partial [Stenotrophomonas maltophilia]
MPSRFGRVPGPGMARAFAHRGFRVAAAVGSIRRQRRLLAVDQRSRLSTPCGTWLAWASMAVPA